VGEELAVVVPNPGEFNGLRIVLVGEGPEGDRGKVAVMGRLRGNILVREYGCA
jgi:hypothetical protein